MKLNMILGKKQIILASLVLILGIAVYLNWTFANDEAGNIAANGSASSTSDTDSSAGDSKNYGDAQLVDNQVSGDDYFAQARLDKQKAREEAVETLSQMLGSSSTDSAQTEQATEKALATAKMIESESTIENLVKSKGFADCVTYLSDGTAKVVVKTEGLDSAQAAQIKNIVLEQCDVEAENISIVEVN